MAKSEPHCVLSFSLNQKATGGSVHKVKLLRIILDLSLFLLLLSTQNQPVEAAYTTCKICLHFIYCV